MKRTPTLLIAMLFALLAAVAEDETVAATSFLISMRDCDAKGDGLADDSSAFQKALVQPVNTDHSVARVPAGAHRLGRQVAVQIKGAVGNGLTIAGIEQRARLRRSRQPAFDSARQDTVNWPVPGHAVVPAWCAAPASQSKPR